MQKADAPGIKRLPDGRLRVRATAKCPDTGKMKEAQRTMREGATIEEAIALRDSLKGKLSEPKMPDLGPQITTLADYADVWVERKTRRWRAKTIQKNVRTLAYHILPSLGHIRLDRLTRRDVSGWILHVEQKRMDDGRVYATATVKSWWRVLRNILRDAYAQGYISEDLTHRHEPPSTGVSGRQEKRTLTAAKLGQLVEAARKFQPARYAEVVTLAYTGMRVGELYGLHWRDVDLSARRIHIRHSVWKGNVNATKTGVSRTVPMTELVADALQSHREEMMREQAPGLDKGIVFPSTLGTYRHTESLRKPLNLLSEHLGFDVRVTPQVLRRTFNTLLVEAKIDRITIRSMTGHSSERMTEHYAGIGDEIKRRALGTLVGSVPATCDQAAGEVDNPT